MVKDIFYLDIQKIYNFKRFFQMAFVKSRSSFEFLDIFFSKIFRIDFYEFLIR